MSFFSTKFFSVAVLALLLSACQSDNETTTTQTQAPETGALTAPTTNGVPPLGTLSVNSEIGGLITRLSDSASRPSNGSLKLLKTDYSRIQAENADGSELLVFATNDSGLIQYALLSPDGGSLRLINLPAGNASGLTTLHDEAEARWHPSDASLIRFIQGQNSYYGSLKLFEYNIDTDVVSELADLTGKLPPAWGNSLYGMTGFEGTFSQDGNRMAWIVESGENNAETTVGYVAFDVRNGGQVLGTLDYDGRNHDHLSISPSGDYVVISATNKTTSHPVDFSSERILLAETQHSDLCITAQGDDCYVSVSFDDSTDPNYGWIFLTNLVNGDVTPLLNIFGTGNTSLHLSGRALDRPGWALMSTYNCSSTLETARCNRLSLIELSANPRIIDLTGTHSSGEQYYAEPHGTISRDGNRAYFNSDWDDSGSINVYRLEVPEATYTGN